MSWGESGSYKKYRLTAKDVEKAVRYWLENQKKTEDRVIYSENFINKHLIERGLYQYNGMEVTIFYENYPQSFEKGTP